MLNRDLYNSNVLGRATSMIGNVENDAHSGQTIFTVFLNAVWLSLFDGLSLFDRVSSCIHCEMAKVLNILLVLLYHNETSRDRFSSILALAVAIAIILKPAKVNRGP